LLQGLVMCGTCGRNLATSSQRRAGGRIAPLSPCTRATLASSAPLGTSSPGGAGERLLRAGWLEQVTPLALEAA